MTINKEIITKFLEEALDGDGGEFNELEADYEFDFEDGVFTCSTVETSCFRVELSEYEISFDGGDNPVAVSGKAYANYTVTGKAWDGDEDGGYLECAEGDSGSDFKFWIGVNKTGFDENSLAININ